MTAEQLRAARAMLAWNQIDLAMKSGVSVETIKRLEKLSGALSAQKETLDKLEQCLLKHGVYLLENGEYSSGGTGVRFVMNNAELFKTALSYVLDKYVTGIIPQSFDEFSFDLNKNNVHGVVEYIIDHLIESKPDIVEEVLDTLTGDYRRFR